MKNIPLRNNINIILLLANNKILTIKSFMLTHSPISMGNHFFLRISAKFAFTSRSIAQRIVQMLAVIA